MDTVIRSQFLAHASRLRGERSRDLVRVIAYLWIIVCIFFGLNHYFSINSNINNPIVHWWVPVAKDAFWLAILLMLFYLTGRAGLSKPLAVLATLFATFSVFVLSLLLWIYGTVDISYIKILKNLVLYFSGGLLFSAIIGRHRLSDEVLRFLLWVLQTSLVVGLGLYYLHEIRSADNRLYGTYGNPNSLALAVLLTLLFNDYWMLLGGNFKALLLFPVAFYGIMLSGSMSMIFASLVMPGVFAAFVLVSTRRTSMVAKVCWRYVVYLAIFLATNAVTLVLGIPNIGITRSFEFLGRYFGAGNVYAPYAVEPTKFSRSGVIVLDDAWTDNAPVAGSIAWNTHKLIFRGTVYRIKAGSSSAKYLVWDDADRETYTGYTEAQLDTMTLMADEFVIAVNKRGVHYLVWRRDVMRRYLQAHPSESVSRRLRQFSEFWSVGNWQGLILGSLPRSYIRLDSTLLSYKYHFGLAGLVVIVAPFVVAFLAMNQNRCRSYERTICLCRIQTALVLLLVLNLPLHHQFEIFPTNFLIALMFGLGIIYATEESGWQGDGGAT